MVKNGIINTISRMSRHLSIGVFNRVWELDLWNVRCLKISVKSSHGIMFLDLKSELKL